MECKYWCMRVKFRLHVRDMILLLDGRICSVSEDGSIKVWNVETGVCDLTIDVGNKLSKVIQLHDGRLVVSDDRRSLYMIGEYNYGVKMPNLVK
jgi:WD40 repeat protein